MLEQLFEFISARGWHDVNVLPFFSMVDRRRALHKQTVAELRERFPSILETEVPYGSEFEHMAARRAPVESYAPASSAAETYRSLWREIDERLTSLSNAQAARALRAPRRLPKAPRSTSSRSRSSSAARGRPGAERTRLTAARTRRGCSRFRRALPASTSRARTYSASRPC